MRNKFIASALFFVFFIIYYLGSFSKVPFGDCIGFVLETEKAEFTTSTSTYAHFLFINTLVLLKKILPNIESSEIGRFALIFSSLGCLVVLYQIAFELTKNRFSSFFSCVIFGFSFSFWRNSEIVEVYTFNLFWVGLFLFFAVKFILQKNSKHLLWSAVFLGISLFSHIQNILMVPAFLLLLFYTKDLRKIFLGGLVFSVFLLILVGVAIINGEGITAVFSSGVVNENVEISGVFKGFLMAVVYLVYNFWYFLIFSILGMIFLYKSHRKTFWFLIISALPVFCFSVVFSVSDNYVFFIPFNFIIAIFIGIGIFGLIKKRWTKIVAFTSFFIPLIYIQAYRIAPKFEKGSSFDQEKSYKGGLRYYLLPWMNDNVGILEFTIEKRKANDDMEWMTKAANEFIGLKKMKGYSLEEIKKL